jgi:hypothetical protein
MNKKIMVLVSISLLSSILNATEGGDENRGIKRPQSPSFEQQRQLPAPSAALEAAAAFKELAEEQVSFEELNISLDYDDRDLDEYDRAYPSLTNSNALRIFYKYSTSKNTDSIDRCIKLFKSHKLDLNEFYMSHSGDIEIPLMKALQNTPLTNLLLKLGADPYKGFEYNSGHITGVAIGWITPLSMVCLSVDEYGDDTVKIYVQKKYDFNIIDPDGITPLHYLIAGAPIETIAYCLVSGVINVELADNESSLEEWIDDYLFDKIQLHKDLLTLVKKQQNKTFTPEDRVRYKEAFDLLEEQRELFTQDYIQENIEEKTGKKQNIVTFLKDRACGIKR